MEAYAFSDKYKTTEIIASSCFCLLPFQLWFEETQTGSGSGVSSSVLTPGHMQEWISDDYIPLPSRLPFEITHRPTETISFRCCFSETGSHYVPQAAFNFTPASVSLVLAARELTATSQQRRWFQRTGAVQDKLVGAFSTVTALPLLFLGVFISGIYPKFKFQGLLRHLSLFSQLRPGWGVSYKDTFPSSDWMGCIS